MLYHTASTNFFGDDPRFDSREGFIFLLDWSTSVA